MSKFTHIAKKYKILFASLLFMLVFIPAKSFADNLPTSSALFSPPVSTVATFTNDSCDKESFLGLEPWYHFLPAGEIDNGSAGHTCDVRCFNVLGNNLNQCGNTKSDIPYVLLAIIDDLLRISGLVAVGFVFYGAFKYVGSQGSPDATASAQSTIINALIGLAIASIAVLLVQFIGTQLTK